MDTKVRMKTIEKEYFNGRQSVEFKGIYEYKGHKLKINIDIDSYDFQSSARIYIFHPQELKWNVLQSIHYNRMESAKDGAVFYQRKVDKLKESEKRAIQEDINELLRKAKKIL